MSHGDFGTMSDWTSTERETPATGPLRMVTSRRSAMKGVNSITMEDGNPTPPRPRRKVQHLPSPTIVSIGQAAQILGVSIWTLRLWDESGKLKALRTVSGHRRYRVSDLMYILENGATPAASTDEDTEATPDTSDQ